MKQAMIRVCLITMDKQEEKLFTKGLEVRERIRQDIIRVYTPVYHPRYERQQSYISPITPKLTTHAQNSANRKAGGVSEYKQSEKIIRQTVLKALKSSQGWANNLNERHIKIEVDSYDNN